MRGERRILIIICSLVTLIADREVSYTHTVTVPGDGVVSGGEAHGMSPAGLESVPLALAVVVAGAIALHEQPALRGGGEPDERVAALLRTLAAGRPIVDLWGESFG